MSGNPFVQLIYANKNKKELMAGNPKFGRGHKSPIQEAKQNQNSQPDLLDTFCFHFLFSTYCSLVIYVL
jgi:hypothetical protein